jgi:negative regulator of flagellin synthesis FlgM
MIDPVRTGQVSRPGKVVTTIDNARRATVPAQGTAADAVNAESSAPVSLARLVTLAADLASAGPPVDYQRIAGIRQAIADGSYKLDADAVAKAMVGFGNE